MKVSFQCAAIALALTFSQSCLSANFSFIGLGSVPSDSYSTTVNGITATITSPTAHHHLKYFSVDGIDGIGASSNLLDPAAVQLNESLMISFSEAVTVGSITVTQWDGDKAAISSAGGNLILSGDSCPALTFACTSETFSLNSLGAITSLTIKGDNFISAFLLAGLNDAQTTVIPIPAAGWLFISALAGLISRKRLSR